MRSLSRRAQLLPLLVAVVEITFSIATSTAAVASTTASTVPRPLGGAKYCNYFANQVICTRKEQGRSYYLTIYATNHGFTLLYGGFPRELGSDGKPFWWEQGSQLGTSAQQFYGRNVSFTGPNAVVNLPLRGNYYVGYFTMQTPADIGSIGSGYSDVDIQMDAGMPDQPAAPALRVPKNEQLSPMLQDVHNRWVPIK